MSLIYDVSRSFWRLVWHPENKRHKEMLERLKWYDGERCGTLCAVCIHALTALVEPDPKHHAIRSSDVMHQASFTDLEESAKARGCELCALLLAGVIEALQARYPTAKDSAIAFRADCQVESGFAFHPWTSDLDIEVAPTGTGVWAIEYILSNPGTSSGSGRGSHLGITLSIERLAGGVVHFLGREVAPYPPLGLAAEWLENCTKLHVECSKARDRDPPTRIIDVGPRGNTQIVLREGLKQKTSYVALSHCWGAREPPLLLRTTNKERLLTAIPHECLAKNFQDAVTVTQFLGYRYLWIDTLCIIQDSQEDWERECARMESVYANAALTTAAADAANAYAGFLNERPSADEHESPIPFELKIGDETIRAQISKRHLGYEPVISSSIRLNSRGWAFQERHLSSRSLYFAEQTMFFECNTSEHHESLHYPIITSINKHTSVLEEGRIESEIDLESCERHFYDAVENYSKRSLTKTTDRLPAFSAIARQYHKRTGDIYLAGIWRNSLAKGLSWARGDAREVTEVYDSELPVPSWSWASCKATVLFSHISDSLITLIDAQVTSKGLDSFGDVRSGLLKITGRCLQARVKHCLNSQRCKLRAKRPYTDIDADLAHCTCDDEERCARKANNSVGEDVICLFLTVERASWRGLILTPVEGEAEKLRRIGLAEYSWMYDFLEKDIDALRLGIERTLSLV